MISVDLNPEVSQVRRRPKLFRVFVLFTAMVLFGAACSENDDARKTADAINKEIDKNVGNGKPIDGGGGDKTDDQPLGLGGLIDAAAGLKVEVRYRMTTQSSRDAEPETKTMTFAQDPPKKALRSDDTIIIIPGDGSMINCKSGKCSQISGMGELAGSIISGVLGAFFSATNLQVDIEQAPDFKRTDERKIAGLKATCFSYRPPGSAPGTPVISQCVDSKTGILLSFKTIDGTSTTEVVAEDVGTPDSKDFTPPSKPEQVPGIPGLESLLGR